MGKTHVRFCYSGFYLFNPVTSMSGIPGQCSCHISGVCASAVKLQGHAGLLISVLVYLKGVYIFAAVSETGSGNLEVSHYNQ